MNTLLGHGLIATNELALVSLSVIQLQREKRRVANFHFWENEWSRRENAIRKGEKRGPIRCFLAIQRHHVKQSGTNTRRKLQWKRLVERGGR